MIYSVSQIFSCPWGTFVAGRVKWHTPAIKKYNAAPRQRRICGGRFFALMYNCWRTKRGPMKNSTDPDGRRRWCAVFWS